MQQVPPGGDAFLVNTSATDRLSQQLFQEQMRRQSMMMRQGLALDQSLRKNFLGLRNKADVQEYSKAYQDWKSAQQDLTAAQMRGNISPEELVEKQINAQEKLGHAYEIVSESKRLKDEEMQMNKARLNPKLSDQFNGDFDKLMEARRNMSLSELKNYKDEKGNPIDLSDPKSFEFNNIHFDADKLENNAFGKYTKMQPIEEKTKDGLQTIIHPYSMPNNPDQYQNMMKMGLFQNLAQGQKMASHFINQVNPEDFSAVQKEVEQQNQQGKYKLWGLDKPPDFSVHNPQDETERYLKYKGMLHYINAQPQYEAPVYKTNEAAKMAYGSNLSLHNAEVMESIRNADAKGRMLYSHGLTNADKENALNQTIGAIKDSGVPSKPINIDGKNYEGKEVQVPVGMDKKYEITNSLNVKQKPYRWIMTDDGQHMIPLYNQYSKDSKGHVIMQEEQQHNGQVYTDEPHSKPIPMEDWKLQLAKDYGAATKAVHGGSQPPTQKPSTKSGNKSTVIIPWKK